MDRSAESGAEADLDHDGGSITFSGVVARLERVRSADAVADWLRAPVPALGGETPLDLIARGETERVARLVSELEDTGAS